VQVTQVTPIIVDQPNSRRRFIVFGVVAAVLCACFAATLIDWVRFALSKERNTYLVLVPVISAYLTRTKRREIKGAFTTSILPAVISLVVGASAIACLLFAEEPGDRLSIKIFALLSCLLAGAFVFIGRGILRQITFPIAFLIFAVPVPTVIAEQIEIFLQHTSAEAAYWLMSLIGIPMVHDGVMFRLPNISLQVAQECSGYNSTFALFMVSTVAGYMFLKSRSQRTILCLAVIPLAIFRNGFRVTTLAALCVYINPALIDSYIHHKGGPIFFALSLIPFFLLLWGLRKLELRKERKQ
jgi:exosortase C (VPDSG-CTERM-specific)